MFPQLLETRFDNEELQIKLDGNYNEEAMFNKRKKIPTNFRNHGQ